MIRYAVTDAMVDRKSRRQLAELLRHLGAVRITAGPLWAIAAVLFLTGIFYAMRRQSSGTEMEVEERRRAALKRAHARLFAAVARALRESDPMDLIAMGAPSDEYEPAVGAIIPRLASATSVDDVQNIVHEEFAQWFTSVDAGPPDRYRNAATAIWNAYQSHR